MAKTLHVRRLGRRRRRHGRLYPVKIAACVVVPLCVGYYLGKGSRVEPERLPVTLSARAQPFANAMLQAIRPASLAIVKPVNKVKPPRGLPNIGDPFPKLGTDAFDKRVRELGLDPKDVEMFAEMMEKENAL